MLPTDKTRPIHGPFDEDWCLILTMITIWKASVSYISNKTKCQSNLKSHRYMYWIGFDLLSGLYVYPAIIFSHLKVSSYQLLFSSTIFDSNVNFYMFRKISLICVSLAAFVTLEWSLPRVRPHVPLQSSRISASIVALVTFERLFSYVCLLIT